MPDDHALIFDLSKKVTKDTDIYDLCEKKRIERTNKMWQEPVTTGSAYDYTKNRSRSTIYNRQKKDADDDDKKNKASKPPGNSGCCVVLLATGSSLAVAAWGIYHFIT